jgi:hypothetical protein
MPHPNIHCLPSNQEGWAGPQFTETANGVEFDSMEVHNIQLTTEDLEKLKQWIQAYLDKVEGKK